ncbi:hypothetical protein B0J17DRAFT_680048 [Rhizoctonia solani]|nr:hypothetical protein B0J17DRAFT_680048 [Rhizoctonia solani]
MIKAHHSSLVMICDSTSLVARTIDSLPFTTRPTSRSAVIECKQPKCKLSVGQWLAQLFSQLKHTQAYLHVHSDRIHGRSVLSTISGPGVAEKPKHQQLEIIKGCTHAIPTCTFLP